MFYSSSCCCCANRNTDDDEKVMMMMMMRSTREEGCSSDDDDDVLPVREGNSFCSSFIFEEKKLLFSSLPRKQVNSLSLSLVQKTHTQTKPHTKEERARASLAGHTTTTRGSLANARGKESVVAANSTRTSKIKRKREV